VAEKGLDQANPDRKDSSNPHPIDDKDKNEEEKHDTRLNLIDSPRAVKPTQKADEVQPAKLEDVPLDEGTEVKPIKPKRVKSKPLPQQ
jgi:hypothetical protein